MLSETSARKCLQKAASYFANKISTITLTSFFRIRREFKPWRCPYLLGDLEQYIWPLCASLSSSVQQRSLPPLHWSDCGHEARWQNKGLVNAGTLFMDILATWDKTTKTCWDQGSPTCEEWHHRQLGGEGTMLPISFHLEVSFLLCLRFLPSLLALLSPLWVFPFNCEIKGRKQAFQGGHIQAPVCECIRATETQRGSGRPWKAEVILYATTLPQQPEEVFTCRWQSGCQLHAGRTWGPSWSPSRSSREHGQRGPRLDEEQHHHIPNSSPKSALNHSVGLRFGLWSQTTKVLEPHLPFLNHPEPQSPHL